MHFFIRALETASLETYTFRADFAKETQSRNTEARAIGDWNQWHGPNGTKVIYW